MKIAILALLLLPSCAQRIAGIDRSTRMIIYGDILDIAGHPEIGEPLKAIARTLGKQPLKVMP